tara:strand:+ start:3688 stop:5415 length:1728 start_codon:yes stop_codon:yes gene_type:complete
MENKTRKLIEELFSLSWCRDNVVAPVDVFFDREKGKDTVRIALSNFEFLATVGDKIIKRIEEKGYEIQFIHRKYEEIQGILDRASRERLISGDSIDSYEFSEDDIFNDLDQANEEGEIGLDFEDFDEEDEAQIMQETADLSREMMGDAVQRASAKILISSSRTNVSDIHIEPSRTTTKIRVRRDGVLQNFVSVPGLMGKRLTAALKNMAQMDISERRASQDGKIRTSFEGQVMEFRCSTAPGKYGEKMVLRILNANAEMLSLDTLISNEKVRADFRNIISLSNGIVIVSGPTGSGKSTTLASALREKDDGQLNIVTAEQPIEYDMGGDIQQFQVEKAKGQTFAMLLKTFLRQDPDVILIGETRDPETADASMDAAETGHLVFTTLHANSASSSLTRLLDMDVPGYKLTGSLRGILAQRLLRKVCPDCSVDKVISEKASNFTGLKAGTIIKKATVLGGEEKTRRRSEGTLCTRCNGTGYKGRIGTYELMTVTRNIQNAIKQNKTTQEIEDIARAEGMLTLKDYAIRLVEEKETTLSELLKILNNNIPEEQDEVITRTINIEKENQKLSPELPEFLS